MRVGSSWERELEAVFLSWLLLLLSLCFLVASSSFAMLGAPTTPHRVCLGTTQPWTESSENRGMSSLCSIADVGILSQDWESE